MYRLDETIQRTYFRLTEYQRQRLRFERLLHPENFRWSKGMPPMSATTKRKVEELEKIGFGEAFYQRMVAGEEKSYSELAEDVAIHPLWPHCEPIPGFGVYLCGAFIAAAGDIGMTDKCSSFWKGMGLDIVDGKAPRRVRGAKVERKVPALPHVTRVGDQIRKVMLQQNPFFHELYMRHKEDYMSRYPEKAKMFAHKHGLRIAQKILYACLWKVWRERLGLPAPFPYVFAMLKHDDGGMINLEEFYERK